MDEIESKIYLVYAAFLHDIGKIAQRTGEAAKSYNNETIYQMLMPYFHQGKPSHFHALYTYDFMEERKHFSYCKVGGGEPEDNIATLAFKHHNPSTPLQKLMAEADRLSSGQDRKEKDEADEQDIKGQKAYLKVPLQSLFGMINLDKEKENKPKDNHYLPLQVFPKDFKELFPQKKGELKPNYGEPLTNEYKKVYSSFCRQLDEFVPEIPKTFWDLNQFLILCE
ncbi:MAG: HD domain-containing protein, partial [Leptospiraceae bacterium]|nr:HD domain-containing protein [Leptospiraceae bacterium]